STSGTAPGQLSIDDLRRIYRADTIGPRTAVYGVVGPTIDVYTLTKLNDALRARLYDAVVVPFPKSHSVGAIVRALTDLPVDGWLLTTPVSLEGLAQSVPLIRSAAGRTDRVTAIVRQGDELIADDIAPSVESVLEFWFGGLAVVGSHSASSKLRET